MNYRIYLYYLHLAIFDLSLYFRRYFPTQNLLSDAESTIPRRKYYLQI